MCGVDGFLRMDTYGAFPMRGTLYTLFPDRPREVRDYLGTPSEGTISRLVLGLPEFLSTFDHWIDEQGNAQNVNVFINQEGSILKMRMNFPATAQWHYILRAKGLKPIRDLHGPVVIAYGDDDFMEAL